VFSELRQNQKALALSVLFHAVIIAIIFINFSFSDKTILVKQAKITKTVKAEVIDQQLLEQQKNKKKAIEDKRRKEIEKKKREMEAEKRKTADKKKKQEAKKKAAANKKKKEEAKKKAAAKKKKKQEAERQAATKKKAEQEKQQELEQQKKLETEKQKKLAEENRLREELLAKEAEQKRLQEEKKKQEAEKRRLAEEEQKRRQQELNAQLQAEETQIRLNSLREKYILAIKQKIQRNWRQPQEAGKMPECELKVLQGPGGIILDVSFGTCTGGSPTYRKSIENAVYKSDPLPEPGDPSLFDRELNILFTPG
jgi:colicin import membrane protein